MSIDPANASPQVPSIAPDSIVDHGTGEVSSAVGYTDADFDTLTYSGPVAGLTAGGGSVVVYANGSFSYTPTAAQRLAAYSTAGADVDTFDVTIADGHGSTQTVSVTVTIDAVGAVVTSTASNAGTATGWSSVAPDGTRYQLARTGSGTDANSYQTTVTITHLDGTITTTAPIPGDAWLNVDTSQHGTAVLITLDRSMARVTLINPDGSTVTSSGANGYPRGAVVGSDGTIAMEVDYGNNSTRILVMRPDGFTTVTDPVARSGSAYNNAFGRVVVGADGTVAKPIVNGSGTAADPYQTALLVIHPNSDGSTTTTLTEFVAGLAEDAVVGADGTAGVLTTPTRATAADPYQLHGLIVHADGSQTTFTMASTGGSWSDAAGRLSIGADGTAAASDPSNVITIVRTDGTTITVTGVYGPVAVGGDGTTYVQDYYYATNTTAIRPDGSRTTLPGAVAVAADGTAYHSYTFNGSQTRIDAIAPNGTTTVLATIDGTPYRNPVRFGPDGTAYLTTSGVCGGTACTTRHRNPC